MSDVVASWEVPLVGQAYRVEFEHGSATGKRVVYVNGLEVLRKHWLFKLVGEESFDILGHKCIISIKAVGGFSYSYRLFVDGKEIESFRERQSKILKTWIYTDHPEAPPTRVTLERDTMDVYVNGEKVESVAEFVSEGTETHFQVGHRAGVIAGISSGSRHEGIIHNLLVDGRLVPEAPEESAPGNVATMEDS
ncbi:fas apoptotic inhibitory molecule 1-like [Varroa jacobsoni]|uniref:fas apoptotic inhibitory molecule 1-like n=1 Tax=Varroa jacobsoni TaxID=62625 RepID=UPI000BF3D6ED|nr:fas apoptotic inhibitory molecule 1-like [Varroa jacobsoni]